jgi:hypothetical protein
MKTPKKLYAKNIHLYLNELETTLGPELYQRLDLLRHRKDRALTQATKALASELGAVEFATRAEKFDENKPITMPPAEPQDLLERLLKIAQDKTDQLRSDAALNLAFLVVTARTDRRLLT